MYKAKNKYNRTHFLGIHINAVKLDKRENRGMIKSKLRKMITSVERHGGGGRQDHVFGCRSGQILALFRKMSSWALITLIKITNYITHKSRPCTHRPGEWHETKAVTAPVMSINSM